jgi:hypothetical protein
VYDWKVFFVLFADCWTGQLLVGYMRLQVCCCKIDLESMIDQYEYRLVLRGARCICNDGAAILHIFVEYKCTRVKTDPSGL